MLYKGDCITTLILTRTELISLHTRVSLSSPLLFSASLQFFDSRDSNSKLNYSPSGKPASEQILAPTVTASPTLKDSLVL